MVNVWYIQAVRERNRIEPAVARVLAIEIPCKFCIVASDISLFKHTEDEMMLLTANNCRDVVVHDIALLCVC